MLSTTLLAYVTVLIAAFFINMAIAVMVWGRCQYRGNRFLAASLGLAGLWCLTAILSLLTDDPRVFLKIQLHSLIGMEPISVLWLLFCLEYTGVVPRISIRVVVASLIKSLLVIAFVLTSCRQQLYYRYVGSDSVNQLYVFVAEYGVLGWINVVLSYGTYLVGALLLIRKGSKPGAVRLHSYSLMVTGIGVPLVFHLLTNVTGVLDGNGYDLSALGLALSAILLGVLFLKFHKVNIPQTLRSLVFNSLNEGILILDQDNFVLDCNRIAAKILGKPLKSLLYQNIDEELRSFGPEKKDLSTNNRFEEELSLSLDGAEARQVYTQISVVQDRFGMYNGRLILFQDVSEYRRVEMRERAARFQAEQKARQMKILHELASITGHSDDPQNAVNAALSVLVKTKGVISGWAILQDPESRQALCFHRNLGEVLNIQGQIVHCIRDRRCRLFGLMEQGEGNIMVIEPSACLAFQNRQLPRELRSLAVLPVSSGEILRGLFVLLLTEEYFTLENNRKYLELLANQLNVTLERVSLFNQVSHYAITDPLTNIHNRRYFFLQSRLEIQRCNSHGLPISLLMFDIDFFKQLNDRWGHPLGDRILHEMCREVQKVLRPGDIFGRYGGEEFIICLPEADGKVARRIGERIRKRVARQTHSIRGADLRITVSLGYGRLKEGQSLEELIEGVDRALYRAKNNGRNQIEGVPREGHGSI